MYTPAGMAGPRRWDAEVFLHLVFFFFFNLESLFKCISIFLGFVDAAREEGEERSVLSWLGLEVQNCVLVHSPSG